MAGSPGSDHSSRPAQQWASHEVTKRRLGWMGQEDFGEAGRCLGGWGKPARRWPMADGVVKTGRGWGARFSGAHAPPRRGDFPWGEGPCEPSLGLWRMGGLSPEIEGGGILVYQEAFFEGGGEVLAPAPKRVMRAHEFSPWLPCVAFKGRRDLTFRRWSPARSSEASGAGRRYRSHLVFQTGNPNFRHG